MAVSRSFHTATLLPDGRVLIAGGHPTDPACEIYDPATRTIRRTASLSRPRYTPTATLLADGRVLIAGGNVRPDFRGLPFGTYGDPTSEIFDPQTETFSAGPPMTAVRYAHAATRLDDGRVLVTGGGAGYVGGFSYSVHPHPYADVFDPAAGTFAAAPRMATPRWSHTATKLLDGRVLVVGFPPGQPEELPVAEIYSADATTVSPVIGGAPRLQHSATLLPDGRVLLASGVNENSYDRNDLEVFDPVMNTIAPFGFTRVGRYHAATALADGRVLLTGGGSTYLDPIADADLVDPATNTVTPAPPMTRARRGHRATLLPNGEVLITGGGTDTTEIFRARPSRRRAVR